MNQPEAKNRKFPDDRANENVCIPILQDIKMRCFHHIKAIANQMHVRSSNKCQRKYFTNKGDPQHQNTDLLDDE